jgi:Zn finger protein HypA/HybF involved in hydrogenase expression
MTAPFNLVCEVCAEEFLVADAVYRANPSIVPCPRCGSTDLVLLDTGEDPGLRSAAAVV